jgi:hypothetical protein
MATNEWFFLFLAKAATLCFCFFGYPATARSHSGLSDILAAYWLCFLVLAGFVLMPYQS